jgi:hypothetical protein
MTDPSPPEETPARVLQFDHAEYPPGTHTGVVCGVCKEPVADAYFQINELTACPRCTQAVHGYLAGGSPAGRVFWATLKGGFAAIAGGALTVGAQHITGMGLVVLGAVMIGIAAGKGVRDGSMGRGGWFYQCLAMLLTYVGVCVTFVPVFAKLGAVRAFAACAMAPVLCAIVGNYWPVMGCGYGFYQAWQLNQKVQYEISGPWQLGTVPEKVA